MTNREYCEREVKGLMTGRFTTLSEKKAILQSWIDGATNMNSLEAKAIYESALLQLNTFKTKEELKEGKCIAIDDKLNKYETNYISVMAIIPNKNIIGYLQ